MADSIKEARTQYIYLSVYAHTLVRWSNRRDPVAIHTVIGHITTPMYLLYHQTMKVITLYLLENVVAILKIYSLIEMLCVLGWMILYQDIKVNTFFSFPDLTRKMINSNVRILTFPSISLCMDPH